MIRICFATNNLHKLEEVQALLGETIRLVTLQDIGCEDELPETQATLEGNAYQKARYVWDRYRISCFADDTGLEVDALNKAPGVYSARYAGPQRNSEDNINLLLSNMAKVSQRSAQFRTVISLIVPEGELLFEGVIRGSILPIRKGTGGFGYDSVFQPLGFSRTLAEMTLGEKNNISHRGIAVRKLVNFLLHP